MKAKFLLSERSLKIIEDMEHSEEIGALIIFCRHVPCKEVRGQVLVLEVQVRGVKQWMNFVKNLIKRSVPAIKII